jgi:hypothetical protein
MDRLDYLPAGTGVLWPNVLARSVRWCYKRGKVDGFDERNSLVPAGG